MELCIAAFKNKHKLKINFERHFFLIIVGNKTGNYFFPIPILYYLLYCFAIG